MFELEASGKFWSKKGSLALPIAVSNPFLLWPVLFVWGAFSYGVLTVTLAELGDRFSGPSERFVAGPSERWRRNDKLSDWAGKP